MWLLLLLGCSLLPLCVSGSKAGARIVYLSPDSSNQKFSLRQIPGGTDLEFTYETDRIRKLNFGLDVVGHKVYMRASWEAYQCGFILYDGWKTRSGIGNYFSKRLTTKRLIIVFFNPADSAARAALEWQFGALVDTSRALDMTGEYPEAFQVLEDSLRNVLGASLESPRCFVAVIDRIESPAQQASWKYPLQGSSSSSQEKSRPVVTYLTPNRAPKGPLKLIYRPADHEILFQAKRTIARIFMSTSGRSQMGLRPTIRVTNHSQRGLLYITASSQRTNGLRTKMIRKEIDCRHVFVFFDPTAECKLKKFAWNVTKAIIDSNLLESQSTDPDFLAAADEAVQSVIRTFIPDCPYGYLVVLDPPSQRNPEPIDGIRVAREAADNDLRSNGACSENSEVLEDSQASSNRHSISYITHSHNT